MSSFFLVIVIHSLITPPSSSLPPSLSFPLFFPFSLSLSFFLPCLFSSLISLTSYPSDLPITIHLPTHTVDTAAQLSILCRRIKREGAGRIFICASHGLFTGNSMELIDLSPVEKVRKAYFYSFVTDALYH